MANYKKFEGWLLDVSVGREGLFLWVKNAENNQVLKLKQLFFPEFFAVPRKQVQTDFYLLKKILESHRNVEKVRICKKYVNLEDSNKTPIFGVSVKYPTVFKSTIKDIDALNLFILYNTDLPISQMYFYENDLFPVAFCSFAISLRKNKKGEKNAKVLSVKLEDDNKKLFYALPPLKAVWLNAKVYQSGIRPYYNDPLAYIEVGVIENDKFGIPRADGKIRRNITIDEADEAETLKKLSNVIERLDPDIILTENGDEFLLTYLAARASFNGISKDLYLSRDKSPLKNNIFKLSNGSDHYFSYGIIRRRSKTHVYLTGRLHLDTASYGSLHFTDGNIPGLIEVARISRVPLQRLCRVTIGGALQSIQFYNAYKLDHLVPPFKKNPESFKTAVDLLKSDRGGLIFEPVIGIFDQVVELDFSSMYPSLMAKYNISSETINCECCKDDGTGIKVPGLNFHICTKREGIISKSISLPLTKRLKYKEYNKQHNDLRYRFVDAALKWVLVVSFGYLGFKNARFGKIEAHQTVCAFAREFLLRATEIAREYDCRIIHGIVDSLWLKDELNRNPGEFDRVTKEIAHRISEETRIPMDWSGHYNFIVFLPSKASENVPTLNHYWGIKTNGEIKVRGIELRRRDMPKIVKNAQKDFINVFKDVKSVKAFMEKIPQAKKILRNYVKKIEKGLVKTQDLSIRQCISRRPEHYLVNSYQAVAARQLERSGIVASPGKNVNYIILNAKADPKFPERKVILTELYNPKKHRYDKEKYIELLVKAFENLFPFKISDLKKYYNSRKNNACYQKKIFDFY